MLDSGKIGHQLSLPLSNNTVCHHIDKVANVVQSQLNDKVANHSETNTFHWFSTN